MPSCLLQCVCPRFEQVTELCTSQGALLDDDGQEDVLYEDDFDDEAAMRELEALG